MKTLFNYTLAFLLIGALFTSCKKEDTNNNNGTPTGNPFSSSLADLLAQDAPQPETFTINTHVNSTIRTSNHGKYAFPANAFADMNGNLVSGDVTVKVTEYFNNADLFYAGLSTRSDDSWLVTGGQFQIEANLNGQPLQIANGASFQAFVPNNEADNNMELFVGEELPDGSLNWLPTAEGNEAVNVVEANADSSSCAFAYFEIPIQAGDVVTFEYVAGSEDPGLHDAGFESQGLNEFIQLDPGVTNNASATASTDGMIYAFLGDSDWNGWDGAYVLITINAESFTITIDSDDCEEVPFSWYYQVDLTTLGWVNCDYFGGVGTDAQLTVITEEEHDCANTIVYTVFTDDAVVGGTSCSNDPGNEFTSYAMPNGTNVTICALSVIDGQFYGAFVPVTVSGETTENITLSPMTEEDFVDLMNAL